MLLLLRSTEKRESNSHIFRHNFCSTTNVCYRCLLTLKNAESGIRFGKIYTLRQFPVVSSYQHVLSVHEMRVGQVQF